MKKFLSLLAAMLCVCNMWANQVDTLYWEAGLTTANEIMLSNGYKLAISGNSDKKWESDNNTFTLNNVAYTAIKNGKDAKNTLTAPDSKKISSVTFYVVNNGRTGTKATLSEFEGKVCTDEVEALKTDYNNPTVITKGLSTPANSVTFTFVNKQVCFIALVTLLDNNTTSTTIDETSTTAPSFISGTSYDVTVKRTLIADQWNSLCLPFSMTADEVSAKLNPATEGLMKMTGIENNVVNFEDATTIEAGEMYIVKPTAEVTSFTASSKTLSIPANKTFNTTEWSVSSPMYKTAISQEADNTKFVLSNNQFYTVDQQDIEIKGFRWYITNTPVNGTPAKKTLLLSMNGITTGLSTADIDAESNSNGKFIENGSIVIKNGGKTFNTAGQRVK